MKFLKLDHTNEQISERIRKVFFDSYSVEATLIGVTEFPPLKRTASDIRSAESSFFACTDKNFLAAVTEIENASSHLPNIAGFAVHPEYFRRGVGSFLLSNILGGLGNSSVSVSTASANVPATSLYEKHGFQIIKNWSTKSRISMVTMERSRVQT